MATSSYIQSLYSGTASLVGMKRALVLGFTRKRLAKLVELLCLHGIRIHHHIETFKTTQPYPDDVELVICSTTNNSHASKGLVAEARRRGHPLLFLPDSKSKGRSILIRNGFNELTPQDVIPNAIQGSSILNSLQRPFATTPTTMEIQPMPKPKKKIVQSKPEAKPQPKPEPDLVLIKDAAIRTNVNERKIKDLINQSFIAYIGQEDQIYVSIEEIETYKALGTTVPTITKEEEIKMLLPHYLPLVAKDFDSFGYEYNRKFTKIQKDLLSRSRRPRLWKKALTKAREILGVTLTVQYDSIKYRCTVDADVYKAACVEHNLQGIDISQASMSEHITLITKPNKPKEKPMPEKQQPSIQDLTLQQLIEELRVKMKQQNIVRLDISYDKVKADMVKTVTLNF